MKISKEKLESLKGKPVTIVKGYRNPFALDGVIVEVLDDSIIFKTNICSSIMSIDLIREIRGI